MKEDKTVFRDITKRIKENKRSATKRKRRLENRMAIRLIKEKRAKPVFRKTNRFHGDCDSPGTIENGTATFFWIISLAVGALFRGALAIWIISTIIWWKFITRHNND